MNYFLTPKEIFTSKMWEFIRLPIDFMIAIFLMTFMVCMMKLTQVCAPIFGENVDEGDNSLCPIDYLKKESKNLYSDRKMRETTVCAPT